MTSIQVEYWKLRENERHNMAVESLERSAQGENIRHNYASEAIGRAQAAAAQAQAAVARYRADIEQQYYTLAQSKLPYELAQIAAGTRNVESQAALNYARADQQRAETRVYNMYGEDQARASYRNTVSSTYRNWASVVQTGVETIDKAIDGIFSMKKLIA
jgi:cell division septum initiation protein DivIVA